MSRNKDTEAKAESAEPAPQPTDAAAQKENGSVGPAPLPPGFERFARYFGVPVALQLRTAVMMLDFSGEVMRMSGTDRDYGLFGPALIAESGGEQVAAGYTNMIPAAILRLAPDERHLLAVMQSPATRAVISLNIHPDEVHAIWFVERLPPPPSPIVRPS